jgi:hypothetical protein
MTFLPQQDESKKQHITNKCTGFFNTTIAEEELQQRFPKSLPPERGKPDVAAIADRPQTVG